MSLTSEVLCRTLSELLRKSTPEHFIGPYIKGLNPENIQVTSNEPQGSIRID